MVGRNERPRRAIGKWLGVALIAVVGGALCWYRSAPSLAGVSASLPAAAVKANKGTGVTHSTPAADDLSLPTSLAGSTPPSLPLDSLGRLARTHAVREFFDYFLTARRQLTPPAMDQLVRRAIALQLGGHRAAADEAITVWQHYNVYLDTLAQLPAATAPVPGSAVDYDGLFALLDQRAALGDRIMGEWSPPFFADELQRERVALERRRIGSNATLSVAERAKLLNELDQKLPTQDLALQQQLDQQQAQVAKLMDIESQNLSPDAMRAEISQEFGSDVADRAMSLRQPDDAWQVEYNEYAEQRAQLQQQNLPADQYATQVAQLRQSYFSTPSEIARAASFDRGAQP